VLQFDFDRASLTAESMARLGRIADALRADPEARVKVSGHCDERGTLEYNVSLGQQRAAAARDYLIALGIAGARIDTVSYGAEVPVDPSHDEQAWAKNRRGELSRVR
jgi:peptidoglycan-associated lipoprotein